MADPTYPPDQDPSQQPLTGAVSPEEREAAQAADEADAQAAAVNLEADVAALRAKNAELADQYLRAQADVQNARRRADEENHATHRGRSPGARGAAALGTSTAASNGTRDLN